MADLVSRLELVFPERKDALQVASILVDNGYAVMLSNEEMLTIMNVVDCFETGVANRNEVVFMHREEFEEHFCELEPEGDPVN